MEILRRSGMHITRGMLLGEVAFDCLLYVLRNPECEEEDSVDKRGEEGMTMAQKMARKAENDVIETTERLLQSMMERVLEEERWRNVTKGKTWEECLQLRLERKYDRGKILHWGRSPSQPVVNETSEGKDVQQSTSSAYLEAGTATPPPHRGHSNPVERH